MTEGHCADAGQLARMLEDRLDAGEREAVEGHVQGCAACQAELGRLTAGPDLPIGPQGRAEVGDFLDRVKNPSRFPGRFKAPPTEGAAPGGPDETEFMGPDRPVAVGRRDDDLPSIAGFRPIREVGRGGMGTVYEAVELALGRRVALKVVSRRSGSAQQAGRFRREARAAARLHHTNIVPVFGVGEDGDHLFYAMQLIEGEGLDRLLDRSRRERNLAQAVTMAVTEEGHDPTEAASGEVAAASASSATVAAAPTSTGSSASGQSRYRASARIALQVAEALAFAHGHGILHRDVKPSNILIDAAGHAWVADFGLAKCFDDDEGLTGSGDIIGTLRYMAPERFDGRSDAQGDVYSLGVTLYELLVLRPVFEGSDRHRLIERVLRELPPRPRAIDRRIPRDLETIALKAMAKEPRHRYGSAAEMADDLRRHLAGEPIRARRSGPAERLWRWAHRNPLAAALTGLLAALGVATVSVSTASARREHAMRVDADRMRIDADRARSAAEAALADLREARTDEATFRRAIAAERDHFARDPANRDIQASLDALHAQQGALQRRTGRKLEAITTALARRDLNPGNPDRLYQVAMDLADCLPAPGETPSPGDLDAAGAARAADLAVDAIGRAILAGFRTDEYNLPFTVGSNVHFRPLHPHPGFRSLQEAIRRGEGGRSNGELLAYRGHPAWVESVAITPDGKRALSLCGNGSAQLWDRATGRLAFPPFAHPAGTRGVAIAPDGRAAAIGCDDGLVYLWSLDDGTNFAKLAGHSTPVQGVGFTGDGKTLVSAAKGGDVRVWDVARRAERSRMGGGHQGEVLDLAITRDGHRAVTVGTDQAVWVWDLDAARPLHGPLTGHHGRVWSVAVAPDGKRAYSGGEDGCLIEWDLVEGRRLRTMWGQWATIRGIAIAPDRRRALTGGPKGRLLTWDLASGRPVHRFPGEIGNGLVGVAISPDGRRAVTAGTDSVARVWSMSEDAASARDLAAVGRWDESLAAYRRALAVEPGDLGLIDEAAGLAWRLGRWADLAFAEDLFVRAFPDLEPGRLNQARALLMAGDRDGYRRACESTGVKIADANRAGRGSWILALAGLLGPDSGIDPAEIQRLAALVSEQNSGTFGVQPVVGLAHYRAGRHREAILTILPVTLEHEDWSSVTTTWPMLAMAYHRLGNAAEARKWLGKVRDVRRRNTPPFGRDPIAWAGPWANVWDWIDFELLAREAEATVGQAATPASPRGGTGRGISDRGFRISDQEMY